MSENICIILNPTAKGEYARRMASQIKTLFPRATFKITQHAGEAKDLARDAAQAGFKKIIAAGGDGTINEVVNGLAGTKAILGILPIGSVNVFALELGIPTDLTQAARVILKNKKRKVDLARVNDHYFVQLAGAGLDAAIVKRTSADSKKMLGPLSYLFTLAQMTHYKPPKLFVRDEKLGCLQGEFILIGNGRFYGGPFLLFPKGKVGDGKLDVCLFKKMGYMDIFRYLHGVLLGIHTELQDVVYFQSTQLSVSSENDVPMEVDGEICGNLPAEFSIQKHALSVLI
ncbi:MAG: diacylglycerol/lipid kinase family protein [Verrucomicrobiota bacterium]